MLQSLRLQHIRWLQSKYYKNNVRFVECKQLNRSKLGNEWHTKWEVKIFFFFRILSRVVGMRRIVYFPKSKHDKAFKRVYEFMIWNYLCSLSIVDILSLKFCCESSSVSPIYRTVDDEFHSFVWIASKRMNFDFWSNVWLGSIRL